MIKEDKIRQKQDNARREHERYEAMGMEVMNQQVPLLNTSDWCDFMKDCIEPSDYRPDLITLDGPWGVNVDRTGDVSGQEAVNRDILLMDEDVLKGCTLLRKVLAKNGTILIYSGLDDIPRWRKNLIGRGFQVQQVPYTVVFALNASVFNQAPNAVYNCTHFILRAWRAGETPVVKIEGNGFGHIASDYPARSNIINNYIPVRHQNRTRGLDGKVLRVEEKSPEIYMELIKRFSEKGALVGDFFAGSGASGEAAIRLNRKWIGCDVSEPVVQACWRRLLNYFSSNMRLGLIALPNTNTRRLTPIGESRWRQFEDTLLAGSSSWPNTPDDIDRTRPDVSIREQDQAMNGNSCYVAVSSVPEIRSQNEYSQGLFAARTIKKGQVIGMYWGDVLRILKGEKLPRDMRKNRNLLYITHGSFKRLEYLYIIPNQECMTRFINCARVPGAGKTPNFSLLNAEFVPIFDYDAPSRNWLRDAMFGERYEEIKKSCKLCVVRAFREIEAGEEIFVDYGRKYWEKGLDSDSSSESDDDDNTSQ